MTALHSLNAEGCTCGCKLTLAQCRIYDSACRISKDRAAKILADLSPKSPENAVPTQSSPPEAPPAAVSPLPSPEKSPRRY